MTAKFPTVYSLIAAAVAVFAMAGTASAQSHGGGGGGGHAMGGGGHATGGGGGHAVGGGGHAAGGGGGHAFSSGARGYAGAQHIAPSTYGGFRGGVAGYAHGSYAHGGYAHGGYTHGGGYYAGHSYGGHWGGGYWGGGYWPRAWYGPGFAWFLPVLPLAYATYWWGGVPFYYANDVYYTWNPSYDGYVATDPPPVSGDAGGSGAIEADGQPAIAALGAQVFMYPRNGQSEAQQATDREECQRWAGSQAAGATSQDDYRRAMTACAEARGYSVR
jgi:hypothetical protein